MKNISLLLAFIFSYLLLASSFHPDRTYAQVDQITIPNVSPVWIKRQSYSVSTGIILSKKGAESTDTSIFSIKSIQNSLPAIAGGGSVLVGSLFTWTTVRSKNRMFKKYLKQIQAAGDSIAAAKNLPPLEKKKSESAFEDTIKKLQEEIDLAAADRRIDEEQRTTLAHAIERISPNDKGEKA